VDATPRPRGPSGRDLLAGTPEAVEYLLTLASAVFPDGLPSPELACKVAGAIWRHLHDHRGSDPVAWDPSDATGQRISAAFQRDGLAAAFAVAAATLRPPAPARLRVSVYREELLP